MNTNESQTTSTAQDPNASASNAETVSVLVPVGNVAHIPAKKSFKLTLGLLPRRKIAHLPQKTRDSINFMIRNHVPLREITSRLCAAGEQINKDNLLRWKKTGYRKWLNEEQRREDSHSRIRFLLSLVQEKKNNRILQAGQQIAVLQVADILSSLDPKSLRESFQDDPAHYVRLLNALPRLTEGGLACDRQRAELAKGRESKPAELGVITPETLEKIEAQLRLL